MTNIFSFILFVAVLVGVYFAFDKGIAFIKRKIAKKRTPDMQDSALHGTDHFE